MFYIIKAKNNLMTTHFHIDLMQFFENCGSSTPQAEMELFADDTPVFSFLLFRFLEVSSTD